jgi:hypothetical protein
MIYDACKRGIPLPPASWQVLVLMRLLDNFLMPDDLPAMRADGQDDWVYSLPGRKQDKALLRLAAANAEAEGQPADSANTATSGKEAGGKGGSKAAGGGNVKGAAAGGKAADSEGADAAAPPRPFSTLMWTLPQGALDLASLGWTSDPALPQVTVAGKPEEQSAAPATPPPTSGGKSSTAAKGAKSLVKGLYSGCIWFSPAGTLCESTAPSS